MKKISLAASLVLVLIFALVSAVQARTPQDTLNQYISQLQSNPNDNAQREKIIKFVQTMNPAPVIPEEARKHFVEAGVLLKGASDKKGYELAIAEYRQALLVAPWWADAYFNLGAALELDGQYDEATNALNLYLETGPEDARTAQDKIYEIDAKKKLAAQKEEEAASRASAPAPDPFETLLKKIDGRRYTYELDYHARSFLEIRNKVLVCGVIFDAVPRVRPYDYHEQERIPITSREIRIPGPFFLRSACRDMTAIISDDGEKITLHSRCTDGTIFRDDFYWQQ